MKYNVFYYDSDKQVICSMDVLNNVNFINECDKQWKKYELEEITWEAFLDKIEKITKRYFKQPEYEISIRNRLGKKESKTYVFDQLQLNWELFTDSLINRIEAVRAFKAAEKDGEIEK